MIPWCAPRACFLLCPRLCGVDYLPHSPRSMGPCRAHRLFSSIPLLVQHPLNCLPFVPRELRTGPLRRPLSALLFWHAPSFPRTGQSGPRGATLLQTQRYVFRRTCRLMLGRRSLTLEVNFAPLSDLLDSSAKKRWLSNYRSECDEMDMVHWAPQLWFAQRSKACVPSRFDLMAARAGQ